MTIFGAPDDVAGADVVFVGAPFDRTAGDGCRRAPERLRALSQGWPVILDDGGRPRGWYDYDAGRIRLSGVRLADGGDARMPPGLSSEAADERVFDHLRARVAAAGDGRRRGPLPVLLGGEHAVTRAAVRSAAERAGEPVFLVLFDAHPDRGPSHLGGRYPRDAFVDGILADGTTCGVVEPGVRDLCHPDHGRPPAGWRTLSPAAVRDLGPSGLRALVPDGVPLYVSFDVDVLDPSVAPASTTLVPGGLFVPEARALLEALGAHPRLVGFDLTEYDPSLDPQDVTGDALLRLAIAFLDAATRG